MTTSQSDAPWLTQEAYDRLSKAVSYTHLRAHETN